MLNKAPTRVALVWPGGLDPRRVLPLAYACLAANTPKELCEFRLFDLALGAPAPERLAEELAAFAPEVVGLSCFAMNFPQALAAARAGAEEVVANDVDPWAIAVTRLAARRQQTELTYLLQDITEQPAIVDRFDVVLCSDMAYERRMTPRYYSLLQRARSRGARVFVADAGRKYFDASGLQLLAEFRLPVPHCVEPLTTT